MISTGARTAFFVLLLLSTVFAGVNSVVNQARRNANEVTADRYTLTLYVILQIHEHPHPDSRALQDLREVAACQANVVKLVNRNAAAGARTVVMEGLFARGSLSDPQPVLKSELADSDRGKAKWLLAQRRDLFVYGFELAPINEFGVNVAGALGSSMDALDDGVGALDVPARDRERGLVQEERSRLNLWYAGIIPQRSFLALQTALAVALARGEQKVQLVIGKLHWPDLVYAINRHDQVRIRLVPHAC